MTPLEMAMALASSSSKCEKHKCPFMTKCKGDYTTCVMKEVALALRSQKAEIDTLSAQVQALRDMIDATHNYIIDIEKINKRYHDIIIAFNQGYRPRKVGLKGKPRYKPLKDPTEMDGKERYACDPPRTSEPDLPLVVI